MAITAGTYRARATGNVVLGTSTKKGTPFIEFYFAITDGESKGGSARWTSYFSEKTSARTIESLAHCGWRGEDLSEFSDGALHGLDACEVEVVIELEEYEKEGEKRTSPRVAWVNKIGAGKFLNTDAAMNVDTALSFGEKMRALVMAVQARESKDADFPGPAATGTPVGKPVF